MQTHAESEDEDDVYEPVASRTRARRVELGSVADRVRARRRNELKGGFAGTKKKILDLEKTRGTRLLGLRRLFNSTVEKKCWLK